MKSKAQLAKNINEFRDTFYEYEQRVLNGEHLSESEFNEISKHIKEDFEPMSENMNERLKAGCVSSSEYIVAVYNYTKLQNITEGLDEDLETDKFFSTKQVDREALTSKYEMSDVDLTELQRGFNHTTEFGRNLAQEINNRLATKKLDNIYRNRVVDDTEQSVREANGEDITFKHESYEEEDTYSVDYPSYEERVLNGEELTPDEVFNIEKHQSGQLTHITEHDKMTLMAGCKNDSVRVVLLNNLEVINKTPDFIKDPDLRRNPYKLYTEDQLQKFEEDYAKAMITVEQIYNNKDLYEFNENFFNYIYDHYEIDKEAYLCGMNNVDNVIEEFGMESEEAEAILDLVALDESVEPSIDEFNEACQELQEIEDMLNEADALTTYATEITPEEITELQNMATSEVQDKIDIATEKVESNPLGFINKEDQLNANTIAAAAVAAHPIKYAITSTFDHLKSIPNAIREQKAMAEAAGVDYRNSAQKVADAIALKAGGLYQSAKMATVSRLQTVAEKSAEAFKSMTSHLKSFVESAKSFVAKGVQKITRGCDIVLNTVSLGAWEQVCKLNNDVAKDHQLRQMGVEGRHTLTAKYEKLKEKNPDGLMTKVYGKLKDSKILGLVEQGKENLCYYTSKAHYSLSGTNVGLDSKENKVMENDYWKDINSKCLWHKEQSPLEIAVEGAKLTKSNIDKSGGIIKYTTEAFKTGFDNAKEFVDTHIKEPIVVGIADLHVKGLEHQSKEILKNANDLDHSMKRNASKISSLKAMDQNIQEKMDVLKQEIHDLQTTKPYERQEYKMNDSIKQNIEILQAAAPCAKVNFALNQYQKQIAKEERKHNTIEYTNNLIAEAKQFVVLDDKKSQLRELEEKAKRIEHRIDVKMDKLDKQQEKQAKLFEKADLKLEKAAEITEKYHPTQMEAKDEAMDLDDGPELD